MPTAIPPEAARTGHFPAPVGGINSVGSGLGLPPTDCVKAINVVAAENGVRVRYGEQEWATGCTGDGDDTVRTVLSFLGSSSSALFAVTNTGIWDVSSSTATPSQVVTFPSSSGNAGWGVACTYVASGGHYLFYADEANGLYRYSESGATWTKVAMGSGPGEIDGVDPADVAFVTSFKGRLWVVERDTASAWYLPVGQVAGTAAEFPVGTQFSHGGTLLSLHSWTYDGGSGVDDSLVMLATGGDVLVYQGTDPSSPDTFALRGVWYAGPPPAGRRAATDLGGALTLITRRGLLAMAKLVVSSQDKEAETTTAKIGPLLNATMVERANTRGWALVQHPEDATLLLLVPRGSGEYAFQLAQSSASGGWFLHRGLDMTAAEPWEGKLYYGTSDGRVCVNTGYLDGVTLADPDAFTPIDWSLLTAATDFGSPVQKQVGLIRPLILSDGLSPSFVVQARYGYSQREVDPVSLLTGGANTWDSGVWDEAVWGGEYTPVQKVRGSFGMGTAVAIAMRGVAVSRTVLIGFDLTYEAGGFL